MPNTESSFLESRRNIRKLKTVVNVLEETINILEEALEASPHLGALIPDPEQWLQLWVDHIDSFRASIRDYYFLLKQSSLVPQQVALINNSLHAYSTQVTQYVQLVQACCLSLLSDGGEDCFTQIEDRINRLNESLSHLAELADVSLIKTRLTEFREMVLHIEHLIDAQSSRILEKPINLSAEKLDDYRQLVTFLQVHIITWEGELAFYEEELNHLPLSVDRSLDAPEQIRNFMADLGEYIRLVQKIYRNLLEG
ncbi:hypothetical protein [Stenomitos frigidus]|uniref:Uncharacterized protein n=1 Tax=Stenomitos frigidus ULC18 TaxID=2107698 RepID=A0A2T1EJ84_9CYAN|nr:hypothetical protein [Stenomitos frigidus]PSB32807.1 hypothetical protein C7B82_05030 [Stenomitos frigidus ULC18]